MPRECQLAQSRSYPLAPPGVVGAALSGRAGRCSEGPKDEDRCLSRVPGVGAVHEGVAGGIVPDGQTGRGKGLLQRREEQCAGEAVVEKEVGGPELGWPGRVRKVDSQEGACDGAKVSMGNGEGPLSLFCQMEEATLISFL